MALLHVLLLVLHVVTAAAWFGMALRLSAQARSVGRLSGEAHAAMAEDGMQAVRLMGVLLLLTFVFSMGLLALGGGYPGQWQYHAASALIVVLLVLHYVLIRPGWASLAEAAASEATGESQRKRIAMSVGMGHLIWLVLVVLMFWNRIVAVV